MKKTLAIIIAAIMCLTAAALTSCAGTPAETTTDKAPETTAAGTTAAETTAEAVTTAAETTAEEVTTEAATTAADTPAETTAAEETPGGDVAYIEEDVALFEYNEPHNPISAANGFELACKFKIEANDRLIGLTFESCPTWTKEGSGFFVELYKWDTDYESTVMNDPIYSEEFTDWVDNAACEVSFLDAAENGFKGGTYMWVFRGTTPDIGIWAMDPSDECEYFENGTFSQNGFRCNAVILTPEG